MCKKIKGCGRNIDKCMKKLIEHLNSRGNCTTLASCCGHHKYNMSIVVKIMEYPESVGRGKYKIRELLSGIEIPRKKRFYVKDKQGYYYIPEAI